MDINFYRQRLAGVTDLDLYLAASVTRHLQINDELVFHTLVLLSHNLQAGHSCLDLSIAGDATFWEALDDEQAKPGYTFPDSAHWQQTLTDMGILRGDDAPVVLDGHRLYLRRYWLYELQVAHAINSRCATDVSFDLDAARDILSQLFEESDGVDWQKVGCANALVSGFSVIAGGPGTGKTTTVARVLAALIMLHGPGLRILLVGPTGKAAQRLSESLAQAKARLAGIIPQDVIDAIPESASTIHRALGVRRNKPGFHHDKSNLLEVDYLLVDETSMVDLGLSARLLSALPEHARIIALGDVDQLPSVAAGSVLSDLVDAGSGHYSTARLNALHRLGVDLKRPGQSGDLVTRLTKSHRFDGAGPIGLLASAILQGRATDAFELLNDDLAGLSWAYPDKSGSGVIDRALPWAKSIVQAESLEAAFELVTRYRILSPVRVGQYGVEAINERLQEAVKPGHGRHYAGRPILITENHYGVNLFNGDVGLIWPDQSGQLMAWFPHEGGYRSMAPGRLPKHETCYAMTIHKTQGSEFDKVLIVARAGSESMLSRELLFTAVTRAKQSVQVMMTAEAFHHACANRVVRHSGLSDRLVA